MKILKHIAVLATAALMIATSNAADSFSPASLGAHQAVAINPATGVQVYPPSFVQLFGFNGDITNAVSGSTGTNIVITPGPEVLYISSATNINIAHATNKTAGTYWSQHVVIKADTADHTLTTPSYWNWATNKFDTNQIVGKLSTIQSNTFVKIDIDAVGTNVLIQAKTYRP